MSATAEATETGRLLMEFKGGDVRDGYRKRSLSRTLFKPTLVHGDGQTTADAMETPTNHSRVNTNT